MSCTVAIVIGHRAGSPGAVHSTGLSEFEYNQVIAGSFCDALNEHGVHACLVYRQQYKTLPDDINALKPDLIVSLHCNGFRDASASGTEVLYYHTSKKGKALATSLQAHVVAALGLKDRGIEPCRSEDRGGYLLRYTHAPCVICEPGFLTSPVDFQVLTSREEVYCAALVAGVLEYARANGLMS